MADENIATIDKQLISQTEQPRTRKDSTPLAALPKNTAGKGSNIKSNFNLSFNNSFNTSFATNNNNGHNRDGSNLIATDAQKTTSSESPISQTQPPTVTLMAQATNEDGKKLISHGPLTIDLTDLEQKLSSQFIKNGPSASPGKPASNNVHKTF